MKIFLAIVYIVEGCIVTLEGYEPRMQADLETCKSRADYMAAYLETVPGMPEAVIGCVAAESETGAVDIMKRHAGERL